MKLTTLTVDKETANLVHSYCVFNEIKMQDFVENTLQRELQQFKQALEQLRKIK